MKIKLIDFGYKQAPCRKHYNDAGADIYCPENSYIRPGRTKKIPLGFGVEIPDGYFGLIYPRSSLCSEGISCEMPPIDSGYRGEIHCVVTNHGVDTVQFKEGDRIGQLVIQPVVLADYVTDLGEERKDGAFGSTGK